MMSERREGREKLQHLRNMVVFRIVIYRSYHVYVCVSTRLSIILLDSSKITILKNLQVHFEHFILFFFVVLETVGGIAVALQPPSLRILTDREKRVDSNSVMSTRGIAVRSGVKTDILNV